MKRSAFCLLAFLTVLPGLATAQNNEVSSLEFLPPPPAAESPDMARDEALYQQTRALKGSDRWNQATFDADYALDGNAGVWFVDSFGITISKKNTPDLYALMSLAYPYIIKSSSSAKNEYQRVRPYVLHKDYGQTCDPGQEETLKNNGSYPSGHSTLGWGMALLLAELSPERKGEIYKRGYELGQSRVICGFHWQSDVDAGRMLGAAVISQLHLDPQFPELFKAARQEVEAIRAQGGVKVNK